MFRLLTYIGIIKSEVVFSINLTLPSYLCIKRHLILLITNTDLILTESHQAADLTLKLSMLFYF